MSNTTPTLDDVEAAMAAAIEPLREQLRMVEGRERLIQADLTATREVKNRLLQTLRRLDPAMSRPGPKARSGGSNTPAAVAKRRREATEAAKVAIDSVASERDGGEVTKSAVYETLKRSGQPIGQGTIGTIMETLHESGYLTLHRLGTGGHKIYKRTEDMSNGEPRPAN